MMRDETDYIAVEPRKRLTFFCAIFQKTIRRTDYEAGACIRKRCANMLS